MLCEQNMDVSSFSYESLYVLRPAVLVTKSILRNSADGSIIIGARDSIEILWYLIPVRCTIELTEKEQWGSYPLFPKTGAPGPWAGTEPSAPDS